MKRITVLFIALAFHVSAQKALYDSLDTGDCMPPCRAGYFCREGECLSRCNPPCAEGQACSDDGECLAALTQEGEAAPAPVQEPAKQCPRVLVVRPTLTGGMLGGSFTDEELQGASNALAAQVRALYEGGQIVGEEEQERYAHCQCAAIVLEVLAYHTEKTAAPGRRRGNLTVRVALWDGPAQPGGQAFEIAVEGRGGWGESTPLVNAFEEAGEEAAKALRHPWRWR